MVETEVHSILLKRRERALAARSEVLDMLELKEDRWFGGLEDDSPKVKRMRRVYLHVDYTQAPWTVIMLRQPSQNTHTSREAIDVLSVIPQSIRLFVGSCPCWRHSRSCIIICNKYRV